MKSPVLFQNQAIAQIGDSENHILVAPNHGARILKWMRQGREVIRWPDDADWQRLLKVRGGNPVLFPFVARHFVDGRNEEWRDEHGVVRAMPQHGFARNAVFDLIEQTDARLRMRLVDTEETRACYPFSFQFEVVVELQAGSRLEIRFETTNRSIGPLPYYAGHHFYLALPHADRSEWTLQVPCASWGRQRPDGAIVHEEPTSGLLRLDDPAMIDRMQVEPRESTVVLANGSTNRHLALELRRESAPWYAVTTWTENAASDFYCVEPWLGLPNAIHHGEGLRHIAPGAMESAVCILDASGW